MPAPDTRSARINQAYYGQPTPGLRDYWNKMAAPRQRAATFAHLLAEEPPIQVVDLGCGNGLLLSEIGSRFPEAGRTGIDLSKPQIEANRETQPKCRWLALDLEEAGIVPERLVGAFDTVIASEIVEHLRDPEAFLEAAHTLATPASGRLLLSTQSGALRETERRVGHRCHFTSAEMRELLERTGWRCERVWNCGFPFHDLSKWWANRDPDATMARFSGEAYGASQKLVCVALRAAFRLNSRRRGAQLFAVARA
jgi:SAM-dependent methyltransferase